MGDINLTFDEYLTMKALKFKAESRGLGGGRFGIQSFHPPKTPFDIPDEPP